MKKITVLLLMAVALCGMQLSAQPAKGPARSNNYSSLPSGYQQLGSTSIYYNISQRFASGPGSQYGISILGKIGNVYYSSTFEHEDEPSLWNWWNPDPAPGAGFIAAMKVNDGNATYMNALNGTTSNGVKMVARLEPQGEVAARVVYTLTNNNSEAVTVSAGVWGDIMIGDNDNAPLERLVAPVNGYTYGIKMKYSTAENAPLLCALFGDGVTGVTPADDYWFGFFSSNWHANEIVGGYSNTVYNCTNSEGNTLTYDSSYSQYYLVENGSYDSGLGFCWKDRIIPPGESIELSYVISVGEIDFEEPIIPDDPEPGEDHFTYEVEVYEGTTGEYIYDWNDLAVTHKGHIWGYYEHPYGQNGYIEYMVDGDRGTGEWTSIETPLLSGATYELPFDVDFNPDITDLHTLQLRFTDGLGNYTALEGLEWEDVRSIDLTVNPEVQYYDGTPKTFVVTVGGVIDYTLGEDGAYTNPGDYEFSIEGVYEYNTIGVNTVEFTVDKGQSIVDVVVPDDVEYDGNPHGATVTLVQGDGDVTVTYVNTANGAILTEAPTEVGVYVVIVAVADGECYYGIDDTTYGPYTIYVDPTAINELTIDAQDNNAWYTIDGRRVVAPTAPGIYIHNGKKYIVK